MEFRDILRVRSTSLYPLQLSRRPFTASELADPLRSPSVKAEQADQRLMHVSGELMLVMLDSSRPKIASHLRIYYCFQSDDEDRQ